MSKNKPNNTIFPSSAASFNIKHKETGVKSNPTTGTINKKSSFVVNSSNNINSLAISTNNTQQPDLFLQTSILSSPHNLSNNNIGLATPSFKESSNMFDLSRSQHITMHNNIVSSSSGNVKVMCRFRPISDKEKEQSKNICADFIDDYQVAIKTTNDLNTYRFSFDRIFPPKASQKDVFDIAAKPIIDSVLEGFNGTIFAYGQTSSGKTYTMMGDLVNENNSGIIPRMVRHVFHHIENSPSEYEYIVKVSMMEIYMERIKDLIDIDRVNLNIREDKNRGNFVEDLSEHYVSSEEEIMELVQIGANNRTTKFTNMNDFSSRSHTILMLMIKSTNIEDLSTKIGKLFLVDLAGSEKIAKTGATGLTLEEAKNINKSLTTLGMVINSLTDEKSNHVPYRESKVTRILQESLGGNAKTCLIITCSPSGSNDSETLSTLRFGMRAKKIENKPKINKEISSAELKAEIERLESLLQEANIRSSQLEKLLLANGLQIPNISPSKVKNKSPKKIDRGSFHKTSLSIEDVIKHTVDISHTITSFNSKTIETANVFMSQQDNKPKSNKNTRYFETGTLSDSPGKINFLEKDNQQSSNLETNKVSNLLIENRNLMKKLLDLDEIIKKQKIETEENQRAISDLFEIKYKFEEIEMNNISKIEFLERKIKKLRFEYLLL